MKKIYIIILIATHFFFNDSGLLHCTEVKDKEQGTAFPAEQQSTLTALKKLDAQQNGKLVEVQGEVQNISSVNLSGFITVYLLEKNGGVAAAQDVSIAGSGKMFSPGDTIAFTATLQVPAEKKIMSVSVDFTKE
ncbi:MAG: hypothetical protein D3903_01405 [Candidatus Electrothrix sp. GM3_4]|nr:hypothetical protein [Candidatus Electrothrix sp. GM3_4]